MIETPVQKVSLKGIFERDSKFLLVCEANGEWELPGGRLELGEEIEAGFEREISEELGWTGRTMGKISHICSKIGQNTGNQYIVICAVVEAKTDPIVLSDEHVEYGWFVLAEIEKLNILPDYIIAIKKSSV